MLQNNSRHSENGNVFLIILLAVVLFGALAFFISRGMRSETTSTMSQRQAELLAVDILDYSQRVGRAVAKLQTKGISENDISFENDIISGYEHIPAVPDENGIFKKGGGNMKWQTPQIKANDGSNWVIIGDACLPDIGKGSTGCASNSASDEELILYLANIRKTVCEAINRKMHIEGIPVNTGDNLSGTKFTGTFSDGKEITLDKPYNTVCFNDSGQYFFYHVLIAR